ncbi:hypothetical protein G7Z12_31720 [Streptomyces sp. ID38640]|nr:hypothetical protein G7Z12_31720 [Streptomyces sp. ID38640]
MGAALSGAVVAATAGPARAASRPAPAPSGGGPARRVPPTPVPVPPLNVPALRAALSDLEHPQLTAAQLRVSGSAGHWYGNAGVADRDTGRGVHERDTFRIGSITLWGKTGERYGYCSAMVATRDQQRRAVFSFNPTRRDATQVQVSQRIGEALTKA